MRLPQEHRFKAPRGELCWFEWGQGGAAPTLLFLHATGFHARCWDATIRSLPQHWHVIALDLRGHGRSYRPDTLLDWHATADDVAAFVEKQLTAPALVIGHSMGGFVAARVAALQPARISQLLLVDPVMMTPDTYLQHPAALVGSPEEHPVARRRNAWESPEQMVAHFANREPYAHWRTDVLDDYCHYGLLPAASGEGLELACPPVLEASAYMGSTRSNPYGWTGEVSCPATILRARCTERTGPMDFSNSPTDPDLWQSFRLARDIHWPEISHFIPMEQPDRLARLIETLVAD